MKKQVIQDIRRHAEECYPKESCGLVVTRGRSQVYVPCVNTSQNADQHFRISPEEYAAAEDSGTITCIVHSHPDYPSEPSEADLVMCEASGLPWSILEVRGDSGSPVSGKLTNILPRGYQAPLVGRHFHHGVLDCLTLILDFYKRELDIDLGNYEREDDWWDKGQNLYLDNLPLAGFHRVDAPQHGDIILMQVRSPVPNHAGIFLETGVLRSEPDLHPTPMSVLHHLFGRLSTRDVYGGTWLERTVSYWRHKDV